MAKHHEIEFISNGLTAECTPDPKYPNGIDINLSNGRKSCLVELPYPAEGCGAFIISCNRCNIRIGVTAAGRADDPKTVKIACNLT